MGEIVWAACVSHAGGQLRVRESATEQERMDRVYAGWEQLRGSLEQAELDALIVVGTDHMFTFSTDLMPTLTLGRGDVYETWGELGNQIRDVRASAGLSDALHRSLVADDFDVASATGMRLDHAYACPLELLDPDGRMAVVPLSINVFVPPLPSFRRCRDLGAALRSAVASQEEAGRIGVLATGGISHWVGVPETGRINPEWDQEFLDWFEAPDLDRLDSITPHEFRDAAGPGAGELLCWMVALGAAGSRGAQRLLYEPVEAWITGIALVEVTV